MSDVAALEDVCERAWPPRERLELDGAVLRFASGFTRRANSARVDGGGDDLGGLIDARRAGVPQPRPATGLPAHAAHAGGLRAAAARARLRRRHRGGRHGGRGAAAAGPAAARRRHRSSRPSSARSGCASSRRSSASGRPSRIPERAGCSAPATSPRRFALARVDGEPAATGYARGSRTTGSTSRRVATFPEYRRLGLARAVSERLFAWGARRRRAARDAPGRDEKRRRAGALRAARIPPPARLPRLRSGH